MLMTDGSEVKSIEAIALHYLGDGDEVWDAFSYSPSEPVRDRTTSG